MAANEIKKRNWFIKLSKQFFSSHEVRIIEGRPNGRLHAYIYLKLLSQAVCHDGMLRASDLIPYDENMLASVLGEEVDSIKGTLADLRALGLIELWQDGTLFFKQLDSLVGSQIDSPEANRKRLQRAKNYLENNVVDKNRTNCPVEIRDKSKEIKEKENIKEKIPYEEIITYLNEKVGAHYKSTSEKTRELIQARWNQGFRLEDFKKVIDNKAADWLNTEYSKFLRPETLFSNKFEGYLNQVSGGNNRKATEPEWLKDYKEHIEDGVEML